MVSIFSHTASSYSAEMFQRLGRGKNHASILYAEWFRQGEFLKNVEPQARELAERILLDTDHSLPEISQVREEGKAIKFLLRFSDGLESESVIIPMQRGQTLCISSQIGCARACAFCETGRMGIIRNLSSAEIVSQVFIARFVLRQEIRNIVFMGMGEPLDNFDAVVQAIRILTDPLGLGFGPSRITVSTSGVVEGIYRFIDAVDPAVHLAVSVNAPTDAIRNRIMPVNRKWNMAELKKAMQAFTAHPRRKILAEYVMLSEINDSLECADLLGDYLQGLKVLVNLIPYNAQSNPRFASSSSEKIDAFMRRLRERGYAVLIRHSKGRAVMAACGQLGNVGLRKTIQRPILRKSEKQVVDHD